MKILFFLALFVITLSGFVLAWNFETDEVSISTSTVTFTGNLTNFTELYDTPNAYTGSANQCVKVGAGEDQLVFGDCVAGGTGDITSVIGDSYITNGSATGVVSLIFNESRLIEAGFNSTFNSTYALWAYNQTQSLYFYNQTVLYTNGSGISLVGRQFNLSSEITGDNATWNQSYADTLYANITWNYNQTKSAFFYNHTIFTSTSGCSLTDKVINVTITNGALNVTCIDDESGGAGGNPFDQNLNTTNSPTFVNLTLNGNLSVQNVFQVNVTGGQGVFSFTGSGGGQTVYTSGVSGRIAGESGIYRFQALSRDAVISVGSALNPVNIIYINSSSRFVGINITNPTQALNVYGDGNFTGNLYTNNILANTWLYNQTATIYFYNQTVLYTNGSYMDLNARQFNISASASQWFYNQTATQFFYNQTIFRSSQSCSAGDYVSNVSIVNGLINVTCRTDQSGGGGNPFNQILNITSNVTFANITITDNSRFMSNVSASWFKGMFDIFVNTIYAKFLVFNGTSLDVNETIVNSTIDNRINATIDARGLNQGWNKTYNIFDQSLNTTQQVKFDNITATRNISAITISAINVTINGSTIYFNGSDYIWK